VSNTEISNRRKARQSAAPPRKVWRAPKVIEAEACRRAEKDHIYEPEGHFITSLSFDS